MSKDWLCLVFDCKIKTSRVRAALACSGWSKDQLGIIVSFTARSDLNGSCVAGEYDWFKERTAKGLGLGCSGLGVGAFLAATATGVVFLKKFCTRLTIGEDCS